MRVSVCQARPERLLSHSSNMKRPASFNLTARWPPARGLLVLLLLLAYIGSNASWLQSANGQLLDLNEPPPPGEEEDDEHPLQRPIGSREFVQQEIDEHANEDSGESGSGTGSGELSGPVKKYSWIRGTATRVVDAIKSTFNKMPRYFDFNQFVATFNRKYEPLETIFRRAQFLSNCLMVFKARVAYRLGLSSHKKTVNKFSDRSPNEIRRMFMAAPPFEMRPHGQSEQDYYRQLQQVAEERDHWDLELSSSAAADGEPDMEAVVVEEEQAKRRIKRMLEDGSTDSKYESALRDELDGRLQAEVQELSPVHGWRPLPWPGQARLPTTGSGALRDPMQALNWDYKAPQLSEGDSLDWSKHACFHKVYDQGESCGKCYVMAANALVEFYKCSEQMGNIQPRKFSTNYVLNCGQKFSPTIQGCRGGSLLDTLRFLAISGTHSISMWEDMRKQRLQQHRKCGYKPDPLDKKCPLNRFEEPIERWGSIRVELEPRLVHVNQWYEALQDGPLVASVQMPRDIANYQSGTYEGFDCLGSGDWHAMLLVGYGTDFGGRTFWRFRNSWGPDWGDNGHFDLSMSVDAGCLAGGVRVYRLNPLSAEAHEGPGGEQTASRR